MLPRTVMAATKLYVARLQVLAALLFLLNAALPVYAAAESDLDRSLLAACRIGDAPQVADALKNGANPNAASEGGNSCLHLAARECHLKVMRLLIEHGADVNAKDNSGRTVLTESVGFREPKAAAKAAKLLLEAGAKPDDSALWQSSWLNRVEAVKLLLDAGVSPNAGIAAAAAGGHTELARLLLEKGAHVNTKLKGGGTSLHAGASQGGLKMVELLLKKGADPNAENGRHETPLHSAILGGCDLETVKLLVQSGAKLDMSNNEGVTPVRLAAIRGAKPVYDWLVAASGGKEPAPRFEGQRPLEAKSTKELLDALSSEKQEDRHAPQRELVARGKQIMPEALQGIESRSSIGLYELFLAMGPEAEAALPMLESQMDKKEHVWLAAMTIERMKPGALAGLRDETKQKAAAPLYDAIVDPKADVMAGFYADLLARLGNSTTPTILRLLRHPEPRYRGIMAGSLARFRFSDDEIDAVLVKMSRGDQSLAVRTEAADALGTDGDSGVQARAALLAVVTMPRPHDLYVTDAAKRRENYEWETAADRAARSLARFGPSVIDDLIPLLSPPDASHRRAAITALTSIGAPAVPRLIELLAHENETVAMSAGSALSGMRQPAVPALAKAVSTGSEQVIERAANALWWIGPGTKAALPDLLDVAGSDEHSDVSRLAAARAAVKIDRSKSRESKAILSAIPLLIRVLEKGSVLHQTWAAETLGGIGPAAQAALPVLRKRLESRVQLEAQLAISAIESGSAEHPASE